MKTSLVILAAGIGSRFGGGVKQIAPVGPNGEIIIDYSIKDALEAGFNKVVFIIRRDIENDFKEVIGNRIEKLCEVEYVYQSTLDLPYTPECASNRKKPWGTTHALWSARNAVKEPFLVINADDYYGKDAYKTAHDFLISNKDEGEKLSLGMIGFILANTLSDNGGVTRGVCKTDENG
ncbi:MAG: NTP transferase domain-containing protein, partial [Clostridia bacterium]|nr:NTP transferase domain-containing protein [Clostridia bacterium]